MSDTSRRPADRARVAALALAMACAGTPGTARAWTRASVEHVEAQLRVDDAARAEIEMQLDVRVQGGWLTRFEITGVDAGSLDARRPPLLIAEDGAHYTPHVQAERDGSVALTFASRREAPRRGLHRILLVYTMQLKADGKRVGWSLPPWGIDLENTRIDIDAPAGTQLGVQSEDDVAVQRARVEQAGRVLLSFRRAQLPRTLPFAVEFELAHEVSAFGDAAAAAVTAATPVTDKPDIGVALVCAIALGVCFLKRRAAIAIGARFRLRPLPLIALHPGLRAIAMLALALLCCVVYAKHAAPALAALAAAVALAFDRGFTRSDGPEHAPPATRRRRPLAHARFRQWFGPAAWLDATTPLGSGLLASAYALAVLRLGWTGRSGLWLEALLLVTPLWLSSTRLHLPRRPPPGQRATATLGQAALGKTLPEPAVSEQAVPEPVRRVAASRPAPDRAA